MKKILKSPLKWFEAVLLAAIGIELFLVAFSWATAFIWKIPCSAYSLSFYQTILKLSFFGLVFLLILFILKLVIIIKQRKWKELLIMIAVGFLIFIVAISGIVYAQLHCFFNLENTTMNGFYWGPH